METIVIKAPLGAEIRCGDIRKLSYFDLGLLENIFLENLVVLIRNQDLNDHEIIDFGKKFGELQLSNPLPSPLVKEGKVKERIKNINTPEVTFVSNVIENGVALGGFGDSELVWHSDMSSFTTPPNQTILHSIEVPKEGGDTGFNNMYLAYDILPSSIKNQIDGLMLKHDATIDAAGYLRKQFIDASDDLRSSPGAIHPLVRTHPNTKKNCLFLGRRIKSYIVGMEVNESEELLDTLWSYATKPELEWFHQWKPGDLLMWDNRCVMHKRNAFNPLSRRLMHRVVVKGTQPYRIKEQITSHKRAYL
jgi:taurine dioxygenase